MNWRCLVVSCVVVGVVSLLPVSATAPEPADLLRGTYWD